MPFLDDVYKELAEIQAALNRSESARIRASGVTREQASRLNKMADRYPYTTPDAAMAVARFPGGVKNEVIEQLGRLSTQRWMADHPGGNAYGAPMETPGMRRARTRHQFLGDIPPQHFFGSEKSAMEFQATQPPVFMDNPKARRAWNGARQAGLIHGNILSKPSSATDPELHQVFENTVKAISKAGYQVPFHDTAHDKYGYYDRWPTTKTAIEQTVHEGMPDFHYQEEPQAPKAGGLMGLVGKAIEAPMKGVANLEDIRGRAVPTGPVQEAGITGTDQVRTILMAMNAPLQEIQGQVRNIYGAIHHKGVDWTEPQSDFLIAANKGLSSGSGLMVDPESSVAKERMRREAERGKIGGHNVTLGRWIADATPFAADSKPFQLVSGLVDAGVAIKGDPTAWGLGKAGEAAQTRKLFLAPDAEEAAGLVRGVRNFLAGPTASKWLNSEEGMKRIEWLANENDAYRVYRGTNRKLNFNLAKDLADTRSTQEVRSILEKELGGNVREVSAVAMPTFRDPYEASKLTRMGADMPARGSIDATNKDIVGREMEKWAFNSKFTDEETSKVMNRIIRADGDIEINAAVRRMLDDADGILAREGITDQKLRSRLTKLYENADEDSKGVMRNAVAQQVQRDNVVSVGGEPVWDASAHLYVEHAPPTLRLPDPRNVRRAMSKWSGILARADTAELRIPFATLEFLQNELWKPLQLVTRIAWPIRVIGEEQIRLAASGYDSMFSHPASFVATVLGKKAATGVEHSLLDESIALKDALSAAHGDWMDRAVTTGHKTIYSLANTNTRDAFERAWGSEIARLASDPIASHIARSSNLDEVKEWFTRGSGNLYRGKLASAHPDKVEMLANGDYIDTVARRIANAHGGNQTILDAIRTGKFDGVDILQGNHIDRNFMANLGSWADRHAPSMIVGDEIHTVTGRQRVMESYDRAVDKMFGLLMTTPTNKLSRAPMFKQVYWNESERLIGFADESTRAEIISAAKDANLGSRAIRRMERLAQRKAVGHLRLHEVDALAKGHALDSTKDLLYDLTKKNRLMDSLRLVMPFGEAWKEVVTRWLSPKDGILWKNPKSIRRFQQLVQGAQGKELGDFMGAPEGQGFFWENQFGEQVFVYPGSTFLTDKLLGVPIPLTGRVQGLSMFGTVMPGLGPVVQMPLGWLTSAKPGPQVFKDFMTKALNLQVGPLGTVQEQLLPFGAASAEDQTAVLNPQTYLPPYLKSFFQWASNGDQDGKQWNTSVMEVAGYLKSTGEYGTSSEEINRLFDDASRKARGFYLIKGLAAVAAPAAPNREWMVENNNGELVRATILADELRKLRADDYDTADKTFLDKYGEDLLGVIGTSMTTSSSYATPATRDGVDWVMTHPGVEDRLRTTYGFFAPESGPTDFALYNKNFREGKSLRLDPKTWIRLTNDTIGNVMYGQAVDQVGDDANTDAGRAYLREVREKIWDHYPGWQDDEGKLSKPTDRTMIAELQKAVDDPATKNTETAKGLGYYFQARKQVMDYADSLDRAWPSTSEDMAEGRAYLRDIAEQITKRYPAFGKVYDFVLSHEVEES